MLVMGGDENHGGRGLEFIKNFKSTATGHLDIEKQQVWPQHTDQIQRLILARGFAKQPHSRFFFQQGPEEDACQRFIIHQQTSERHHGFWNSAGMRTLAVTVPRVPVSGSSALSPDWGA